MAYQRGAACVEFEMKKARYQNQNVAVLGAGLSGSAAALLLQSEGANVTALDSAEERNLLKSTIDNLRAQGIRIVCGSIARPIIWIVIGPFPSIAPPSCAFLKIKPKTTSRL